MKTTLAIVAASFLIAAPALAQEATPPAEAAPDHFAMIDADQDGALTLTEIQKVDDGVSEDDFAKYDADADEKLTEVEFAKWTSDMKSAQDANKG